MQMQGEFFLGKNPGLFAGLTAGSIAHQVDRATGDQICGKWGKSPRGDGCAA